MLRITGWIRWMWMRACIVGAFVCALWLRGRGDISGKRGEEREVRRCFLSTKTVEFDFDFRVPKEKFAWIRPNTHGWMLLNPYYWIKLMIFTASEIVSFVHCSCDENKFLKECEDWVSVVQQLIYDLSFDSSNSNINRMSCTFVFLNLKCIFLFWSWKYASARRHKDGIMS